MLCLCGITSAPRRKDGQCFAYVELLPHSNNHYSRKRQGNAQLKRNINVEVVLTVSDSDTKQPTATLRLESS